MSASLSALSQRFDQRNPRERMLLVLTCAALGLLAGDALWLSPALTQWRAARQQLTDAVAARDTLAADLKQLGQRGQTQLQQRRSDIASWRQRARDGEATLAQWQDTLVGADEMLPLIERLLARHGQLQVRSLRTLPRVDLLAGVPTGAALAALSGGATPAVANANAAAPAASSPARSDRAAAQALTAPPRPAAASGLPAAQAGSFAANAAASTAATGTGSEPSLYRHGVELTLEGRYPELLAYLKALEAMPKRVLWGGLVLKVEQHPTAVLTLRLYTISRDRNWLEI